MVRVRFSPVFRIIRKMTDSGLNLGWKRNIGARMASKAAAASQTRTFGLKLHTEETNRLGEWSDDGGIIKESSQETGRGAQRDEEDSVPSTALRKFSGTSENVLTFP